MVFSLADSFFELFANIRLKFSGNSLYKYYLREGFTKEEAEGMAWMCQHGSYGQGLGLALGILTVYSQDARIKLATFK